MARSMSRRVGRAIGASQRERTDANTTLNSASADGADDDRRPAESDHPGDDVDEVGRQIGAGDDRDAERARG